MGQSVLPKGWSEIKIERTLSHYENQTEDEAVAEDELSYEDQTQTINEDRYP